MASRPRSSSAPAMKIGLPTEGDDGGAGIVPSPRTLKKAAIGAVAANRMGSGRRMSMQLQSLEMQFAHIKNDVDERIESLTGEARE